MATTEETILSHSQRGMHRIVPHLETRFCAAAARAVLTWGRGTVILTTGFYVAGFAETDGPAGTLVLAKTLRGLGFDPVILTDRFCANFFEWEGLAVEYLPVDATDAECAAVLDAYDPVGMISVERCGVNVRDGYENMRGVDISAHTAPCDRLFEMVGPGPDVEPTFAAFRSALRRRRVPTVGIGDGGNEIGMGNVKHVIANELDLVPCRVTVDSLIVASVSNWGAYGLAAELQRLSRQEVFSMIDDMPVTLKVERYLERTVKMGSVDGVTCKHLAHVDGFDASVGLGILDALAASAMRACR
jgi:hypothetical protein